MCEKTPTRKLFANYRILGSNLRNDSSFVEQVCFTLDGHSCLMVQYFNKKQGNSLAYWPRFMHSRLFK